jgi:linoleoyl-CoA desaturase
MPTRPLTRAQIDALQAELDAVRQQVLADLGERDLRYIRRVVRNARLSAIAGRGLLMFGLDPITWALGTAALANAKILENMEIGHNVMHGQYDWTGDPALNSQTYEWDNVCDGEQWRHSHNFMHHSYTNVIGVDRDFGYGLLRLSDAQPWNITHLWQPLSNLLLALGFQWGVGVHDLELDRALEGKLPRGQLRKRARPFLKKAQRQLFKDYVLFPAIALWNAPRVLAGNLAANLIRNLWAYAVIFCGHLPEGTATYDESALAKESRGDWYIRQIEGSANLEGSRFFFLMSGHLSHQIEHHLFPDLPAHRYPEIAPQVRAICEKYGLRYNSGRLTPQLRSVIRRVHRYALPPALSRRAIA